jgi:hypothetical protein
MKQLERLLFLQGNVCFFCHQPIPDGEASIEHLVASANGGLKDDDNCVVCCKAVNAALGSLSIKAKLQAIVNQRGGFVCPQVSATIEELPSSNADDVRLSLVVSDLQKRGSARPRKVATLRNTINAVFQNKLSEGELSCFMARLEALGYVTVDDTKVTFNLPQVGS